MSKFFLDTSVLIYALDRLSFWDALIVVSAASAACGTIITEDLNHGQMIRGIRINNPFIGVF